MKPKDDLFRLIRSMSMSEKRHFRIMSSRHVIGEENNYLRLFDAIDAQEQYDEPAIKKKFAPETFIRHLPSEKNYLYNLLLESLNAFNRDKTFLARYMSMIASMELLYQRGLFDQCRSLVNRAKKEAYPLEKFSVLFLILRWENLLNIKDEDDRKLNQGIWEELRVIEMMRIQNTLSQIAFNIQITIDKGKATPAFLSKSEKDLHRNYPKQKELIGFWNTYYYHSGLGLIWSVRKNVAKRMASFMSVKNIMDKHPAIIREQPWIYNIALNNIINVLFIQDKTDEAQHFIERQRTFIHDLKVKHPTLNKLIWMNVLESELFLAYRRGDKQSGMQLVKKAEPEIRRTDPKVSPFLYDLFFMLAVVSFEAKHYKHAAKWLNRILNMEREVHLRKELPINARLLYLLVLFESHDMLFDARLRSAKRFIQQERHFELQYRIVEVIRLIAEGDLGPKRKIILGKHLREIRKEAKNVQQESLNKQYDFAEWINRHIRSRGME